MKPKFLAAITALVLGGSHPAFAQGTQAPDGAEVYFVTVEDGGSYASPVTVVFGLNGMGVAPAGTEVANTGHHHLLLNRPALGEGEFGAEELELGLPSDENHIHFGAGQTETTLDLPTGTHTLQLVLGDAGHVPHDPAIVSDVITITIE